MTTPLTASWTGTWWYMRHYKLRHSHTTSWGRRKAHKCVTLQGFTKLETIAGDILAHYHNQTLHMERHTTTLEPAADLAPLMEVINYPSRPPIAHHNFLGLGAKATAELFPEAIFSSRSRSDGSSHQCPPVHPGNAELGGLGRT